MQLHANLLLDFSMLIPFGIHCLMWKIFTNSTDQKQEEGKIIAFKMVYPGKNDVYLPYLE